MSSYTPGAWTAKKDEYGFWGVYAQSGELLAESNTPEDEANIRLMAAAQEMSDWIRVMCKAVIDGDADVISILLTQARAILRRINGEEELK